MREKWSKSLNLLTLFFVISSPSKCIVDVFMFPIYTVKLSFRTLISKLANICVLPTFVEKI